jgi:hypothetical protein
MARAIDNIKKRGRPPADTSPVMVRFPAGQLTAIDEWRRREHDLPTRPEAIRRLVDQALSGTAKGKR